MNIGQEFQNYYVNHLGKGSLDLHNFSSQIESSMTPYILEEREMRATQIDIFSRLMRDRIIWVAGPVDDRMSTIVQAQLMFMDNVDKTDITSSTQGKQLPTWTPPRKPSRPARRAR